MLNELFKRLKSPKGLLQIAGAFDNKAEKVEVTMYGGEIQVEVSRMYEYLPITFNVLMKLSEIFGTREFGTNQHSFNGCETCDYGCSYTHTFFIRKGAAPLRKGTAPLRKGAAPL